MIRSMTGFGDAAAEVDGVHYALELRSLNNKYFKLNTRVPEELAGLEAELESALRRRVHRGSFTLTLKMHLSDALAASRVNESALMAYLEHLETIKSRLNDPAATVNLTELLTLPGVLQPSEEKESLLRRARPVVLRLLAEATDRLLAMRRVEGAALVEDLKKQRAVIRQLRQEISERAPQVIHEYHTKLHQRIGTLTAQAKLRLEENDLIREVAIFADRADISEELSRVAGHVDQFDQIVDSSDSEPAGRTLDFLTQELLREANTIGSKCNDAEISRRVVELKSAIDRIKEQVQNVE